MCVDSHHCELKYQTGDGQIYLAMVKKFDKKTWRAQLVTKKNHRLRTPLPYEVGNTPRVLERCTQWADLAERYFGLLVAT